MLYRIVSRPSKNIYVYTHVYAEVKPWQSPLAAVQIMRGTEEEVR